MRIAYIAAGAGGMLCGSCLHDNRLARALLKRGEQLTLVPTYAPLRTDEEDVSHDRLFLGGINVYLQQKFGVFRHTPAWFHRLLDHPALLRWVAQGAASVDPAKLGELTVSMLQGEAGKQRKELGKLTRWLAHDLRPEVVHLSNSLLLGLARPIAQQCDVPVVCSLSGEDLFLDKLVSPYYEQARELLREKASHIEAFVALNHYYADHMAGYLGVDRQRVQVIPHGLDLSGLDSSGYDPKKQDHGPDSSTTTIGFLARICHDKGLHRLVEAGERLARESPKLDFRIRAAGFLGQGDIPYLRQLESRVALGPLAGRFEYVGELDRVEKIAFLRSLDIFALPTVYPESKGLPALEAMAMGLPVVLPRHGSFPELVTSTGGGLLHEPLDSGDLAGCLAKLLGDSDRRANLGGAGRAAVVDRYQMDRMADQTVRLYQQVLADRVAPRVRGG